MDSLQLSKWKNVAEDVAAQLTSVEKQAGHRLDNEEKIQGLINESLINFSQLKSIDNLRERLSYIVARTALLYTGVHGLSQGANDVSTLIWVILGLVIQGTAHDVKRLEPVIKCYQDLLMTVPALSGAALSAVHIQSLREAIYGVYCEHLDLGLRALKAFGRKTGQIGFTTKFRWIRESKGFYRAVRECKRRQQNTTDELKSLNVDEDMALREDMENIRREFKAIVEGLRDSPSPSVGLRTPDTWTLSKPRSQVPQSLGPPSPRSNNFVGREQQMKTLELKLVHAQPSERELRAVVIHGLGGNGKTHLANEFFYRFRAKYDACFWISAGDPIKLDRGFEDIAQRLNIEEADHAQIRASVIDWLCKTDMSWLLVFDNAEEPATLAEYFPTTSSGSILITTRSRKWIDYEYAHVMFLESFSDDDAVALLQSTMRRHDRVLDAELARDIVHEVGNLPLAISQLGCYISTTHSDAREFLIKYQDLEGEAQRVHNYALTSSNLQFQSLATVWNITLSKLTDAATFLLHAMVMFDPDEIPMSLFIDSVSSGSFKPFLSTTAEYEQSIYLLDQWNLVKNASSHNPELALKIHRELRRRILITASPMDLQRAFIWALTKLRDAFPHQSQFAEPLSRMWKQGRKWISHVISVRMVAMSFRSKLEIPEVLIELLVDGGIYLWERGMLDRGLELISSAEEICNTMSHCSRPLRASIYSFRGCILSDQGLIDKAIECFKTEVNHRREHLCSLRDAGKTATIVDEIQLANGYNNLAGILCAREAFIEAERNNDLSIIIKERWQRHANLDYLFSLSYSNRANVLGLQHQWSEAAIWYKKALDIPRERHYSPRLALIYHNFGTMRLHQGSLDEATKLLADAVELRTEELGYHYDTATSLHTLATCYRRAGKLFEAKDVLIEALEILNSPHLRDRARIARSKYALSLVLEKLGEPNTFVLRDEARRIRVELTTSTSSEGSLSETDASDDSEEDYDCLVPYI